MTTQRHGTIPEWTLADRLRKARTLTGLNTADFAEVLGVSQKTVNNAESDKHGVRKIVLNAWSVATGVSVEWLETGIAKPDPPPGQHDLEKLTAKKRRRAQSTHRYAVAA